MTLSSHPDHPQRYISPLTCPPAPARVGRCPGRSSLPTDLPGNRPADLPAKGFGPGFSGPLEIVGQVQNPADKARFASFVASLQGQLGVARVQPPQLSPNGKAELAVVYPAAGPQTAQTADLLSRVRSAVPGQKPA